MKVHFDRVSNAVYLRLDDSEIEESEEVHLGIVLDFDKDNQVVGIEVLPVQQRLQPSDLDKIEVEVT